MAEVRENQQTQENQAAQNTEEQKRQKRQRQRECLKEQRKLYDDPVIKIIYALMSISLGSFISIIALKIVPMLWNPATVPDIILCVSIGTMVALILFFILYRRNQRERARIQSEIGLLDLDKAKADQPDTPSGTDTTA